MKVPILTALLLLGACASPGYLSCDNEAYFVRVPQEAISEICEPGDKACTVAPVPGACVTVVPKGPAQQEEPAASKRGPYV